MSKIKVGINGFGRIGRLAFRAALKRNDIEIVGINDLLEVDYIAYMLQYDTVHGRFDGKVDVRDGNLVVNGQSIRVTSEMDPANLKWNEVGAEYVIESTGIFLTKEKAMGHITAGASYNNTEIRDENPIISVDQDGLGAQTAMRDLVIVRCRQCVSKLLADRHRFGPLLFAYAYGELNTHVMQLCLAVGYMLK